MKTVCPFGDILTGRSFPLEGVAGGGVFISEIETSACSRQETVTATLAGQVPSELPNGSTLTLQVGGWSEALATPSLKKSSQMLKHHQLRTAIMIIST